ncbi:MAG: DUF2809 domain-containing protein [Planctomycetes bacterium]|nr:DUF2809 domain-containing protein [Planctomycetota bacterium]
MGEPDSNSRARLTIAIACVIVVGLAAKFDVAPLPSWLSNLLGGACYTAAFGLALLWLRPALGAARAAALALLWSCAVELWQLGQLAPFTAAREHALMRLVFGAHFDPWDFLAYALGALLVVALGATARSNRGANAR